MTQKVKTERFEMPLFSLLDGEGHSRGTQALWQRRDMLVAVLHGPGCEVCRAFQAALEQAEVGLQREEAGAVAVAGEQPGGAPFGTRALSDPQGAVAAQIRAAGALSPERAWLLVVNRFGAVYRAIDVHRGSASEVMREALEWLEYAQRQCGECSAPVDWA